MNFILIMMVLINAESKIEMKVSNFESKAECYYRFLPEISGVSFTVVKTDEYFKELVHGKQPIPVPEAIGFNYYVFDSTHLIVERHMPNRKAIILPGKSFKDIAMFLHRVSVFNYSGTDVTFCVGVDKKIIEDYFNTEKIVLNTTYETPDPTQVYSVNEDYFLTWKNGYLTGYFYMKEDVLKNRIGHFFKKK